jgi:hypothetical protein
VRVKLFGVKLLAGGGLVTAASALVDLEHFN